MSLNKIISYVDVGRSSRKGVRLTAAIAENHGASIEVVQTAATMPAYSAALGGETATALPGLARVVLDTTKETVEASLRETVRTLESSGLGGEVTTHRLHEHQVDELIEHARSSNADLIVMSCEAAGLFDRVFHRSFAEKLARRSSCPVMVMAGDTEVTPPLRNILVAIDYSEASWRAAFAAREMVGDLGRLTLQHVWTEDAVTPSARLDSLPGAGARAPQSPLELAYGAERERLAEFVRDLRFTDIETDCCLSVGVPEQEIAALAEKIDADVIVVGSRPHEDWTETLFGTVTDRLIETCQKPILAVPKVAAVTRPMSRRDHTVAQSFPASDAPSGWAGPPT